MIENIPFSTEVINTNDFLLGAATMLALRRGRINGLISKIVPTRSKGDD